MIQTVILAFSLFLITSFAQAQPSAELEAQPVGEHTWLINLNIDELENVFGLQAKFVLPDNNLVPINKKFEHHEAWPEKGKIQLRNFIQAESAEYAVSLVRPASAITLSGNALSFDIKLLEAKPTLLVLDTLKISDENGVVTQFDLNTSQLMIGEEKSMLMYIMIIGAVFMVMMILFMLMRKTKPSTQQVIA
jgi:hypothetical protein